jgi:hypothetical protein
MKKIIFSILLFAFISAKAQNDNKICGDIEKYKKTQNWKDLPGCIADYREEGDESQTTAGILAYAKMQFKNFYDRWESFNFFDTEAPLATFVTACEFFKDPSTKDKWQSDPVLQASEPLFEARSKKVTEEYDLFLFSWKETIVKLANICIECEATIPAVQKRLEEVEKKTGEPIYQLLNAPSRMSVNIQSARLLLDKAKTDKVPDAIALAAADNNTYITIADMRETLLKKWETFSVEADKKERELYESGIAPYMKLMSGEKAQAFKRWYGIIVIRGSGGKKLLTPEELANARVWYSAGSALCTICPRWSLESIHFNGNNIIKKEREEGEGTFPPTSAYK